MRLQQSEDWAPWAGCTVLSGGVVVTGAAITRLPAASVRAVTGSIHIGPTLALSAVDGFPDLESITGSVTIDSNLTAGGVYLTGLRRVGGDVVIRANTVMTGVSLPALESVAGDLVIAANPVAGAHRPRGTRSRRRLGRDRRQHGPGRDLRACPG